MNKPLTAMHEKAAELATTAGSPELRALAEVLEGLIQYISAIDQIQSLQVDALDEIDNILGHHAKVLETKTGRSQWKALGD